MGKPIKKNRQRESNNVFSGLISGYYAVKQRITQFEDTSKKLTTLGTNERMKTKQNRASQEL